MSTEVTTSASSSSEKLPEFEPPLASINRLIKAVLPDNVLLTKDARAAFARAAGIFIFYITHASNEFSRENKRHTIFTADVLNALKEIGFEDFEKPLVEFLEVYRKEQAEGKKGGKAKEAKASLAAEGDDDDAEPVAEEEMAVVEEPTTTMMATTSTTAAAATTTVAAEDGDEDEEEDEMDDNGEEDGEEEIIADQDNNNNHHHNTVEGDGVEQSGEAGDGGMDEDGVVGVTGGDDGEMEH